jgi:hypothetical protein
MQDSFQEGVFAEFTRELYRYGPAPDDLAHLTGVGMAAPPGEDVTNDHQVRARRARWPVAARHCHQCIGGIGVKALALAAGLKNATSRALSGQFEAVDEGHPGLWRKRTFEADHPEPVAPVAEMPRAQLLAVELGYVGICLAVLAGLVAELAEVRAPRDCQQFCFGTWGLGLCFYHLGRLQEGQLACQEGRLGARAIGQASCGL